MKEESSEQETVRAALKNIVSKYYRGFGPVILEYSKSHRNKVWSKGVCYNKTDWRVCAKCFKKSIDQVLIECDNAKGAQYMVKDCFIRYEFYSFV